MKRLLTVIIFALVVSVCADTPPTKLVTEQEAVRIARDQIVTTRPDLEVTDRLPYSGFVPAGPTSGGVPKWVIAFSTADRKSSQKRVYYVTVFPDGRTSKDEVRPGADS